MGFLRTELMFVQWVDQHLETLLPVFVGFIRIFHQCPSPPVSIPVASVLAITSSHRLPYACSSAHVADSLHLTAPILRPPTPHPSSPRRSQILFLKESCVLSVPAAFPSPCPHRQTSVCSRHGFGWVFKDGCIAAAPWEEFINGAAVPPGVPPASRASAGVELGRDCSQG